MVHREAAQSDRCLCGSLFHALQRSLVQVTGEEALCAERAFRFQDTGTAYLRLARIVNRTIFAGELFALQRLTGWTTKRICRFVVVELATIKQVSVSLIVHRPLRGHMWHDAPLLAAFRLFATRITRVSHQIQRLRTADRFFR